MVSVEDFIESVVGKLKTAIAAKPAPAKSLKIKIKDVGVVLANAATVEAQEGAADTVITVSRSDFENLASGKLNPQMAYLQGKIKIEGDPAAALQWLPFIQGKVS
ncbi:SCP2 sterol-binding domain-containing protein [Nitrospirillum viridazoti]|uniref:Sterol-binding protein n=2 Tax=Nitrospirillum TaxID=1543705 RepID=A0A248JU05_9PROT|nr:SCP2 sterol-binding domain-containing protein [Nitrospirillum amazonense]ASG22185.1 sterol-binding protein [Nitrospirillum amazonense CBAmc]EGY01024.1 hypothetical protein AZA_07842 [Nitrospirillum amazonense Y2]TWB31055.1 SCP-2 sterol transfer family protein [Nitrospirillum amazonense]TWB50636.1 SCP-2 sterol transfer family protein [Nitrospirillum amazonense]